MQSNIRLLRTFSSAVYFRKNDILKPIAKNVRIYIVYSVVFTYVVENNLFPATHLTDFQPTFKYDTQVQDDILCNCAS